MSEAVSVTRPASPTRGGMLTSLAAFLEENAVPYVLLGDTRTFPHRIDSDVDIAVEPDTYRVAQPLLKAFCRTRGWRLVQAVEHEQAATWFVIVRDEGTGPCDYFHPDICGDWYRRGRLLLTSEHLLRNRREATDAGGARKGFCVPAPAVAFLYYLLKKLDKGQLDESHAAYLRDAWAKDARGAERELRAYFPSGAAAQIARAAEDGDWSPVRNDLSHLRTLLERRSRPTLAARIGEFRRLVKRIVQPTGLHVALLGPDGSGKSTVIEEARRRLRPAFRHTTRFRLRPHAFSGSSTHRATSDPHGREPRGILGSLAKMVLWGVDYTAGYALRVRPKLVRSTLVVFDRYAHDLSVDPRRYRYGGPLWLARALAAIAPRPDLVLVLDAPPETLAQRKQEVGPAALERLRTAYLGIEGACVVDASGSVEQTTDRVERLVLERLHARLAEREADPPEAEALAW